MSVPDIVRPHLDGEQIAARVPLGGEDILFVTPTRTLIYRADGLLSDESVEEYPHDAERVSVTEGRRKTKIELDYGIDGQESFSVPAKKADEALHPVLAGVLNGAGVTDPGETIKETYRFSELTLVITSSRVVKHIGTAVWDTEFEEFHYEDVRSIDVEEGSVSSQIVVDVAGRPQRVKAQNDVARDIFERLKRALLAYHDVGSYAEFEALMAGDDDESADEPTTGEVSFGGDAPSEHWADSAGVDPIEVNLPDDEEAERAEAGADPLAADAAGYDEQVADAGPAREATAAAASEPPERVPNEPVGSAPAEPRSEAEPEPVVRPEPARTPRKSDGSAQARPKPAETAPTDDGFAESAFETATSNLRDEREETIAELAAAVEHQGELLAEQQRVIERLVEELGRDQ